MTEHRRETDKIAIPNLTDTQKIFASIVDNQISLNTAINDLQKLTYKHHELLVEGNGELPLPERVRNIESFLASWKYWSRFIGGALVLQTIAFAFAIVVAVVRFLPLLESLASKP